MAAEKKKKKKKKKFWAKILKTIHKQFTLKDAYQIKVFAPIVVLSKTLPHWHIHVSELNAIITGKKNTLSSDASITYLHTDVGL